MLDHFLGFISINASFKIENNQPSSKIKTSSQIDGGYLV